MQYPLKISKNPRRRVLERGAGAQRNPRKAEEPRIGRSYGSWTPLGGQERWQKEVGGSRKRELVEKSIFVGCT